MKITFLGDIMCEPPILKASKKKDGTYNFDAVFEKVKPMIAESDYTISNLEFPMAGERAKYTDCFFVFNSPDSFAEATKKAGVDLVSIVNNHTLDRGAEGMIKTMEALDKIGLPYTGTFYPDKGREEAFYFEVDGVKFAVIAYTYATNKTVDKNEENILKYINYLRPRTRTYTPEVSKKMVTWVDKMFKNMKEEHRAVIKMCVGLPNTIERADDYLDTESMKPYMERLKADIKLAKEKADFVIFYPHMGGQFNPEPGEFSKYVARVAVEAGVDAILASHSHMVQPAEYIDGILCAYSLGNFSMSPNSTIIVKKNLPEYGLAMHLYMDGKTVKKVTFSILKAVEKRGTQLVSWPIDELYKTLKTDKERKLLENHVKQVYKYVTRKELTGEIIKKEYDMTK